MNEFDNHEWGAALKECEFPSKNGNPQAQYVMAEVLFGMGDRFNRNKAIKLLRASAKSGYAESLKRLGDLHLVGEVVKKDVATAYDLYSQACELKYGDGCNSVGVIELNSFKYDRALEKFSQAAELGSVIAYFNLGYVHKEGLGVETDEIKAHDYYRKAAMLGSNISQYVLFWHSYKGIGVEKDYTEAYKWLLISEKEKQSDTDAAIGWNKDIPTNVRFFFKKVISDKMEQEARVRADRLQETITYNAEQHRRKYLFARL